MKCELSATALNANGWYVYRCNHRGCPTEVMSPHGLERITNNTICRGLPHWHEIGSWLALFVGIFGISKRNYNWLKRRLGFKKPCGCQQREAAINTIGSRFNQALALSGRCFSKALAWLTGYNTP